MRVHDNRHSLTNARIISHLHRHFQKLARSVQLEGVLKLDPHFSCFQFTNHLLSTRLKMATPSEHSHSQVRPITSFGDAALTQSPSRSRQAVTSHLTPHFRLSLSSSISGRSSPNTTKSCERRTTTRKCNYARSSARNTTPSLLALRLRCTRLMF
jgi:hypothetical protein